MKMIKTGLVIGLLLLLSCRTDKTATATTASVSPVHQQTQPTSWAGRVLEEEEEETTTAMKEDYILIRPVSIETNNTHSTPHPRNAKKGNTGIPPKPTTACSRRPIPIDWWSEFSIALWNSISQMRGRIGILLTLSIVLSIKILISLRVELRKKLILHTVMPTMATGETTEGKITEEELDILSGMSRPYP